MMFISIMILIVAIALPLINHKFIDNNLELNEAGHNILSINNYRIKYSIIVLISTLGSLLLVSSSNLITLYLSLELQSFGVYILASLYRHSDLAISAGLKYFLLGSLASCILLLLFEIQTHINLIENINIILELNPLNNIINNNYL